MRRPAAAGMPRAVKRPRGDSDNDVAAGAPGSGGSASASGSGAQLGGSAAASQLPGSASAQGSESGDLSAPMFVWGTRNDVDLGAVTVVIWTAECYAEWEKILEAERKNAVRPKGPSPGYSATPFCSLSSKIRPWLPISREGFYFSRALLRHSIGPTCSTTTPLRIIC